VRVESVSLPVGALVTQLPFHDYADAYRIEVDPARFRDVDAIARAFTQAPPWWIAAAMRVRDAIVGVFGLKRSSDVALEDDPFARPLAPGAFVGFFRIRDRNATEIVAGEDDRHLDFRVSFLYERRPSGRCFATVSTVVRFHGFAGRAYFLFVGPAHRRIVPAMLRSAVPDTSAF
jgi:hypothetical protein